MKIGIDVFSFDKPGENYGVGPGVYVWHLLPKIFDQGKEHFFYVFANKDNKHMIPEAKNVKIIVSKLPNKFRPVRIIHEQVNIPYYTKKFLLDKIHFLGNNISFLVAKKSIITIYDLMWKYYFDRGKRSLKFYYTSLTIPKTISKAAGIITISKFIADEIGDTFQRRINVFPVLLAPGKLSDLSLDDEKKFQKKHPYNFIFTTTTSMPHKNLITVLKAIKEIKSRKKLDFKLIVAGQMKGSFHLSNQKFISENNLEDDILLLGFISEEEKSFLYRKAKFVIYPSIYEGFGLPILEAMSVGTPVISSKSASMPEVGGKACMYFDPNSVQELVKLFVDILHKKQDLSKFSELGLDQYNKFSWTKVANQTIAVYETVNSQI